MDKELLLMKRIVLSYCTQEGWRTFRLQEFKHFARPQWVRVYPGNPSIDAKKRQKSIDAKIRQLLQELRDANLLTFVENHRGTYTCRDKDLHIPGELDFNALETIERSLEDSAAASRAEKREYIQEVFARDPKWMSEAKRLFKSECMMGDCSLTFSKPDGSPYIEVHHIKPLCEDGKDDIANLATVCAHHHRMAHFANEELKQHVYDTLMRENTKRLKAAKRSR